MDTSLTDPLGRTIVISDAAWFGHILKAHPDMAATRASAERTILSPLAIHVSISDPACRMYYSGPEGEVRMICVVANVERGFVKTAYFCRRIKPGEREWPPPKPSKA